MTPWLHLLPFIPAYFGQELLTTFDTTIGELALIPGDSAVFRVKVNDGNEKNIDDDIRCMMIFTCFRDACISCSAHLGSQGEGWFPRSEGAGA